MFIYVYLLSQTTFLHNRQFINDTINICKWIVSMISRVLFHITEYLNVKFIPVFILKIISGSVSCSTMGLWKTGLQLTGMILLWRIRYYGLTLQILISCLVYMSNSFSSCYLLNVFGTLTWNKGTIVSKEKTTTFGVVEIGPTTITKCL